MEKFTNFHFLLLTLFTFRPLQLIHSNLWGPTLVQSASGYHYYIIFTFLMHNKDLLGFICLDTSQMLF